MKQELTFYIKDKIKFKQQLICWSKKETNICILDGNKKSMGTQSVQNKYYNYNRSEY